MNLESTTMTQNSSDELVISNDLIFSKIGCNFGPIGCQNGQFLPWYYNWTNHKPKILELEARKI
jgi:hypothetical protein